MIDYSFVPKLRSKFVADDGREFELQAFWSDVFHQLSEREQDNIFKTSRLDRSQCRMLWQWLGRTDPVPKSLKIFVRGEDADRIDRETPEWEKNYWRAQKEKEGKSR